MKKILVTLLLIFLLSLSAFASEAILKSSAEIDGIIENQYLESYKIEVSGENDTFHIGKPDAKGKGISNSATAYFLHDNKMLYVAIDVKDSEVYSRGEEWVKKHIKDLSWENDALEVRVYFEELGKKIEPSQYIFQVDAKGYATTDYQDKCKEDYSVATALTDTGYIAEFALPLCFDTKEGEQIGLAIEIDDLHEEITDPDSKMGGNLFTAYGSQRPFHNMVLLSKESAKPNTKTFSDTQKHWAKSYIDYAVGSELFVGSDIGFEPDKKITRAMFASVLARAFEKKNGTIKETKSQKFSDVDYSSWYGKYISWASENKIVNGKSENLFDPDSPITREEMALMLTRLSNVFGFNTSTSSDVTFPDIKEISPDALSAVAYCQAKGYINGKEKGFDPKGLATRAEVATIIYRFMTSLTVEYIK